MKKRILALLLALAMVLSLAACGAAEPEATEEPKPDSKDTALVDSKGQISVGVAEDVEVNRAEKHLDAVDASASGNWEAMFVPIEDPIRNSDYLNFDLTPTAEEKAAMEKEPMYGQTIKYMMLDGCSSGTSMAEYMGYYEEAGLTVEGFKGDSYVEALGTGQVQVAICHIATCLVPITNGVDITFGGGAHLGCKSLYALADSEYKSTEDLRGTNISVPNGVGASDYNITSLMLDDDGINPQTDVNLVQVSADACVAAMEKGEISAALLSDVYAYGMVKDGKLRCVSSMLDSDYAEVGICCALSMSATFVRENPVHAKKLGQAIQKALSLMREDVESSTDLLLEKGTMKGDRDMNIMINDSQQFGLSAEFTGAELRQIVERYLRLGLITNMDNVDEIMDLAWMPVCD